MLWALGSAVRAAVMTAAGTAVIGSRVYLGMAPQDAALPYVLMTDAGGGSENATPRDAFDLLWQIEVVDRDGANALTIAAALRSALHMTAGNAGELITLGGGWHLQTIVHETPGYWVEQVEKRQYHHAVDTYRIIGTK